MKYLVASIHDAAMLRWNIVKQALHTPGRVLHEMLQELNDNSVPYVLSFGAVYSNRTPKYLNILVWIEMDDDDANNFNLIRSEWESYLVVKSIGYFEPLDDYLRRTNKVIHP